MSDGGISRHYYYTYRYHVLRNTVGPNRKTPPKTIKNLENWLIILMHATVWHILNMNCMQRKWCEFAATCLKKIVKSIQAILFSADFSHSEPLSVSAEWSPKILEKRRWVRVVKNLSATGSCISPSFDLVTNIVAWFVLPKAAFSAQEYKKSKPLCILQKSSFLGQLQFALF